MSNVPLPKVDYDAGWHRQYTTDQMHAHAAAVSAQDNAALLDQIQSLKDDNQKLAFEVLRMRKDNAALREALRHYESAMHRVARRC
jgi:septation ring formation regulator EzrA